MKREFYNWQLTFGFMLSCFIASNTPELVTTWDKRWVYLSPESPVEFVLLGIPFCHQSSFHFRHTTSHDTLCHVLSPHMSQPINCVKMSLPTLPPPSHRLLASQPNSSWVCHENENVGEGGNHMWSLQELFLLGFFLLHLSPHLLHILPCHVLLFFSFLWIYLFAWVSKAGASWLVGLVKNVWYLALLLT